MKNLLLSIVLVFAASSSFARPAATPCSTDDVAGSFACLGGFEGNTINAGSDQVLPKLSAWENFEIDGFPISTAGWERLDKSDASPTIFLSTPAAKSGEITFVDTLFGTFGLALKAGPEWSVYLLDGGTAGLSSVTFSIDKDLSHAALYGGDGFTVGAPPIPEPGTYALMLAGLAAVAYRARRRRS